MIPIYSIDTSRCVIPPFMEAAVEEYSLRKNKGEFFSDYWTHRTQSDFLRNCRIRNCVTPSFVRLADSHVYSAANGKSSVFVCTNWQCGVSRDVAAQEAYLHGLNTLIFLEEQFQRKGIDNNNSPIYSTVHYGRRYSNAFWNGVGVVYGEGDGVVFDRFTIDQDITTHELTHGMLQKRVGLNYQGQAGAIEEATADIFGAMVKQWSLGQNVEDADWLIGQKMVRDLKGKPFALRSLAFPGMAYKNHPVLGNDPQVGKMGDYKSFSRNVDHGGVHLNSGIINRAFYLAARQVGGYSWEKVGRVWYYALPSLKADATFTALANETIRVAAVMYGPYSLITAAFRSAWRMTEVLL